METTTGTEYEKEMRSPPPPTSKCKGWKLNAGVRMLLLAAAVAAVVLMVTSKQSKTFIVQVPGIPVPVPVVKLAKFNYSPAFLYLVVALSVTGLYSIITGLASFVLASKACTSAKYLLLFIIYDAVMLGIVASATGTAGSVAYIGLKGNSHVNWGKICDNYGKFCRHAGSSVALSLVASIVLLLLILINSCTLYRAVDRRN